MDIQIAGSPGAEATIWLVEKALSVIWHTGLAAFKAIAPALPDIFTIAAMGCLLLAMIGFEKPAKLSGSFFLAAMIGGMIFW